MSLSKATPLPAGFHKYVDDIRTAMPQLDTATVRAMALAALAPETVTPRKAPATPRAPEGQTQMFRDFWSMWNMYKRLAAGQPERHLKDGKVIVPKETAWSKARQTQLAPLLKRMLLAFYQEKWNFDGVQTSIKEHFGSGMAFDVFISHIDGVLTQARNNLKEKKDEKKRHAEEMSGEHPDEGEHADEDDEVTPSAAASIPGKPDGAWDFVQAVSHADAMDSEPVTSPLPLNVPIAPASPAAADDDSAQAPEKPKGKRQRKGKKH